MPSKMIELIPILIAAVSPVIEAFYDASKKVAINHTISAIVRVMLAFGIASLMNYVSYYYVLLFTFMLLNVYWIVFDLAYNIFKGNNLWYIGQTAETDKMIRRIVGADGRSYLAFKGVLLMIAATLYSF